MRPPSWDDSANCGLREAGDGEKYSGSVGGTVVIWTEPIWGTAFSTVLLGETIGENTGIAAILTVLARSWSSVHTAIQCKVLSFIAAVGVGETSAWVKVDDDDSIEIVGMENRQGVGHAAQPCGGND